MKLAFCLVLSVLALAACAAHNSHRVDVDLATEFDPLVDEAYAQLMTQWPPDEPGGSIATKVVVEPVSVRWLPMVADPAEPALPIQQAAMAQRVEQRLRQLMGGPPDPSQPPAYLIEAELETDLHDPQTITFGLSCALVSAAKPGDVLARGYSKLLRFERLFCHGCNERWSGRGTRLIHPEGGSDHGYVGVGFWTEIYCSPSTSSGSSYTKIR